VWSYLTTKGVTHTDLVYVEESLALQQNEHVVSAMADFWVDREGFYFENNFSVMLPYVELCDLQMEEIVLYSIKRKGDDIKIAKIRPLGEPPSEEYAKGCFFEVLSCGMIEVTTNHFSAYMATRELIWNPNIVETRLAGVVCIQEVTRSKDRKQVVKVTTYVSADLRILDDFFRKVIIVPRFYIDSFVTSIFSR
jgi:hypothetical protein